MVAAKKQKDRLRAGHRVAPRGRKLPFPDLSDGWEFALIEQAIRPWQLSKRQIANRTAATLRNAKSRGPEAAVLDHLWDIALISRRMGREELEGLGFVLSQLVEEVCETLTAKRDYADVG